MFHKGTTILKRLFSAAHYWQNYDMLNLLFFHVFSDLQWRSEAVKKRATDCVSNSRKIKQFSSPADDEPIKFDSAT